MAKGESYHPQFIEDVLNNNVPKKLKILVKPWHKTKWENKRPVYLAEEYYKLKDERSYKTEYLKSLAIIRLYKLRIELSNPYKKHIVIKGNEKRILRQVNKSTKYYSLKYCCELLGISSRRFLQIQKDEVIRKCTPELYFKCNKYKKHQLTTKEVFKIKNILEDVNYISWPVSRLHSYAIRNKIVSASYNSWLMIKNLFEINRDKFKPFNSANKLGIRANVPNELLHTDVSRFILPLNKKVYLFLMMDNYSRYIVNAVIAEKTNHEMNIVHLIQSIKMLDKHEIPPVELMSDKGSENTANSFIQKVKQFGISHVIAQFDKPFSNSMIERMFASLKKFIRNKYKNIEITVEQLKNGINEFVKIHNFEMPLHKQFKTPHELYWNLVPKLNYANEIHKAVEKRFHQNSKLKCVC